MGGRWQPSAHRSFPPASSSRRARSSPPRRRLRLAVPPHAPALDRRRLAPGHSTRRPCIHRTASCRTGRSSRTAHSLLGPRHSVRTSLSSPLRLVSRPPGRAQPRPVRHRIPIRLPPVTEVSGQSPRPSSRRISRANRGLVGKSRLSPINTCRASSPLCSRR